MLLPSSREVHPHFAFASGALNWFMMSDSFPSPWTRVTLSFDLTREDFSLIPLPDDFSTPRRPTIQWDFGRMHELGGSLALVHHSNAMHIDVWVLKDHTSREWTKKYRIDTGELPCPNGPNGSNYYVVNPYKRDKLILHCLGDKDLYIYDVNKERFTRCAIKDIALCSYALFWCETLSFVTLK
ncbi:hypothetical protein ACJRO7_007123 [Eucalyptus globulus]|uniref:F-box associated beta-propeller type 3 domain-containing protein n=1 Tax=Eucalyptus globulus TaxID=34317 RepID=A0ABD3IK39_EUCGL